MAERRRRGRSAARHAPFVAAQVLLVVVAGWWFVLLAGAVRVEDELSRTALRLSAEILASELDVRSRSAAGPVGADDRFEIVPRAEARGDAVAVAGSDWSLQPTIAERAERDRRFRRRRIMSLGEGTLMLVLVASSVGMLRRLVLAERRQQRDVESFLARMAHEMKTPLAGLKALLQTVGDGRLPPERVTELATLGLRQLDREEKLMANLRTARRVATHQQAPPAAELDLHATLSDFVRGRQTALAPGTQLSFEGARGTSCRGSVPTLGVILDNLVDNAFKYGAHEVKITTQRDGRQGVTVSVGDDGAGFAPDEAEGLFRAFHRGTPARRSGAHGTGLGLSISRALARELGGDLTAHSEGPGLGARFTLVLREGSQQASPTQNEGGP